MLGACSEVENKPINTTPSKPVAVETAQVVNPSSTEVAKPEEAKLFPLGKRKPLDLNAVNNLELPAGTLRVFPSKNENSKDKIFFIAPEIHLTGQAASNSKSVSEMQTSLSKNLQYLIENYDINNIGYESGFEIQGLRDLQRIKNWTDADTIKFMSDTMTISSVYAQNYEKTRESLMAYKEGLEENKDWRKKKELLSPFEGVISARDIVEATYIDCPDIKFNVIEADDFKTRNAFDDETRAKAATLQNDPNMNEIFGYALEGHQDSAKAYCLVRNTYQKNVVDPWINELHGERNPLLIKKIESMGPSSLTVFGTYHSMPLVKGLQNSGTVVLVESDGLKEIFDEKEQTDALMYTSKGARQELARVLPDIEITVWGNEKSKCVGLIGDEILHTK